MDIGFISLGCAKNRVDTEIMMARLEESGHKIVNTIEKAEAVIINTCGFISAAKEESIDTIIEIGNLKKGGILKYIIATGCLTQRYPEELNKELPELDGIVGISYMNQINDILMEITRKGPCSYVDKPPTRFIEKGPRVLTTPAGSAYVKISEGCNNRCSYCAIPLIRGRLRSCSIDEIISEARQLVEKGIKELVLIGQDTAAYGKDLYSPIRLGELLEQLDDIEGLAWIRLMYLHPVHIDDALIKTISHLPKIVPYLDIPIQHASNNILARMNRKHDIDHLREILAKLKANIDNLVLRSTVMVGFPGETERDFQLLCDFVEEIEFDWLGAFTFDPEENTPASTMDLQIADDIKKERHSLILELQNEITRKKNIRRINDKQAILISSRISRHLYLGRGYYQAPEVDGITMVKTDKPLIKGEFVEVKLKGVRNYDMIGELDNEPT